MTRNGAFTRHTTIFSPQRGKKRHRLLGSGEPRHGYIIIPLLVDSWKKSVPVQKKKKRHLQAFALNLRRTELREPLLDEELFQLYAVVEDNEYGTIARKFVR